MNERRQERYSPEARVLVEKAKDLAAIRKLEGVDRVVVIREFQKNYDEIVESL